MNDMKQTPEEFDAAVVARFQADKTAEWDALEEEDWLEAHAMYNDTQGYLNWKQAHVCKNYPDHTGARCAVCGKEI